MADKSSGGMSDGTTTKRTTTSAPDRHAKSGRFVKRTTTRTTKRGAKRD